MIKAVISRLQSLRRWSYSCCKKSAFLLLPITLFDANTAHQRRAVSASTSATADPSPLWMLWFHVTYARFFRVVFTNMRSIGFKVNISMTRRSHLPAQLARRLQRLRHIMPLATVISSPSRSTLPLPMVKVGTAHGHSAPARMLRSQ